MKNKDEMMMMGKKKFENGEILIHSFITVKLDYCNYRYSLFYGLPEYLVYRLQSIQNAAAHLIIFTKKGSLHPSYSY